MIDLHTHILFGIDDGAQSIEDSLEILKRAKSAGVEAVALTPHFTIGDDVDAFLKDRDERVSTLKVAMDEAGIDIKLCAGAEVYITDEIYNEKNLEKLTIGDSGVLLAEFRYHGVKIDKFLDYIEEMFFKGIKVLVAHPERYSYLTGKKRLIDMLTERGVMFQVNAISLYEDTEEGDFARMMVTEGKAFCVASDIHHANSRRLLAMGKLNESRKWERVLSDNPQKIFR